MSTYCASCLADLALVREAVTTVSGTAACVAHAVLLSHPGDTPQQRLTRLSDLRAMAEEKLPNATDEDRPRIELLVQEYALAGAMDMTVPLKELAGDRTPRPPKPRRNRGRDRVREGGPRDPREGGPREGDTGAPAVVAEGAPEATMSPVPPGGGPEPSLTPGVEAGAPQAAPVVQTEPTASAAPEPAEPRPSAAPEPAEPRPTAEQPTELRPTAEQAGGAGPTGDTGSAGADES